ncbi:MULTISPECIES: hypothetical protein [unclassified Bradyrhizobium]|uniref:hypothetical protein n=1 Tax=unclassified Bradyrhizobium TaxID=2631580 RepID=UPI00291663D8|nr:MULTISPECIES: hypothetical protein [unclassified Bradyrhizobium]
MSNFAFPVGTKVRLASGGPEMLIVDIDHVRGQYLCAWKCGQGVSEEWFIPLTLDVVRGRTTTL